MSPVPKEFRNPPIVIDISKPAEFKEIEITAKIRKDTKELEVWFWDATAPGPVDQRPLIKRTIDLDLDTLSDRTPIIIKNGKNAPITINVGDIKYAEKKGARFGKYLDILREKPKETIDSYIDEWQIRKVDDMEAINLNNKLPKIQGLKTLAI